MLNDQTPIPLPLHYLVDYDDADGIDADQSPADVGRFVIPFKCQVFMAGLIITEVCAGSTTTPVVDFDLRPTIGSDTDRGAADIAHFICGTTAAGKLLYDEVAKGAVMEVGEEVVVQLVTQAVGGGGHFIPVLLVRYIPETPDNMSDMTETT